MQDLIGLICTITIGNDDVEFNGSFAVIDVYNDDELTVIELNNGYELRFNNKNIVYENNTYIINNGNVSIFITPE